MRVPGVLQGRLPQPHGPERCSYRDEAATCSVRALQRGASPLVTENEIASAIQAVPKSTRAAGVNLRIGRVRLYGGKTKARFTARLRRAKQEAK
jgi:hypothetical protein